jgi:DNA-binding NarL/FixJ family response regulator
MKELSPRQTEIAALVAKGMADKQIAREVGLSIATVRAHIQAAASRIQGNTSPRHRLTVFFLTTDPD